MKPVQIRASPFYGEPEVARMGGSEVDGPIDAVSLADLLRNGFVYPPYSIRRDVRLVSCGFDPSQDLFTAPHYQPIFRRSEYPHAADAPSRDWVAEYHDRLCAAVSTAAAPMRQPWLLQSGGKDSTSLAIAASEARPDTRCLTYLGGEEEDEIDSARHVASKLGLRHHVLACDAGRAYDRYLALVPDMPLLTADFALLSYADLVTEIGREGGDGVIDGMGSDVYLGVPPSWYRHVLRLLAMDMRLPRFIEEADWPRYGFVLNYLCATLQMNRHERGFPGSRFTDAEVDELFGSRISHRSRARLQRFTPAMEASADVAEQMSVTLDVMSCPGGIGKGLYTAAARGLRVAYPYCDRRLSDWITREVPAEQRMDARNGVNKVLIREHIARRFGPLPYVHQKGSFRFNLRDLARQRFDQVLDHAGRMGDILPGARGWLERHRHRLHNKYYASKFYLLAVTLPWLDVHARQGAGLCDDRGHEVQVEEMAG